MRRHKGARPGGRVLDERARIGDAGFICVADRVRDAGIRDAGDRIGADVVALVALCEQAAAAVAHFFDADALVGGGRIAVIDPQEGADLHLFARGDERADVFGIEHDDLTRPELAVILIPEVEVGEAFEARAEAVRLFAEDDRCAAELIARGVDALRREDQHGERTVHNFLRVADTLDEVFLLVDDGGDKLRRVDFAVLHLEEMRAAADDLFEDLLGVVDLADRRYGEGAVLRAHQNRLCLVVGDAADAHRAVHGL